MYYANQYVITYLSVTGGIDNSQTEDIVIQSAQGIDISKPGIACINWADPLDEDLAEWIFYTSIDGSNEFQGVTRGAEKGAAKAHNDGVAIAFPASETHINQFADIFHTSATSSLAEDLLLKETASAPTTPAAGYKKIYMDTDDKLYTVDDEGVIKEIAQNVDGWNKSIEEWTYASWDDTNGVSTLRVYAAGDVTGIYQAGMRVKFSQPTDGAKQGIMTQIGSYDSGNDRTPIDIFVNTDYDGDNEAITDVYFSPMKVPFGFNIDPNKYKVEYSTTTNGVQASPVNATWYNLNTDKIDIPIGSWFVRYQMSVLIYKATAGSINTETTLSTANNTESDSLWTVRQRGQDVKILCSTQQASGIINATSKTTYYLNERVTVTGLDSLETESAVSPGKITAISAFL